MPTKTENMATCRTVSRSEMVMKRIAFLALALLLVLPARAATITGTFIDNSGTALNGGIVRFRPTSNPAVLNTNVSGGIQKSVTLSTNGYFSTTLIQGNYTVTCNGYAFNISVPAGNASYDISQIGTGLNNFPFSGIVKISSDDTTADHLEDKLLAGDNVDLTVVNDGGNEKLRIDVAGDADVSSKLNHTSGTATNLTMRGTNYIEFPAATESDVTLHSLLELTGKDFRRFGAVPDGATDISSAWTNAMASMDEGDTLILAGGFYAANTNYVTKGINIVSFDGSGFLHIPNAKGPILTWTSPMQGIVQGVTFDGNKANQNQTDNWNPLIKIAGGAGRGLRILGNQFTNYMSEAIRDWNTTGRVEIAGNAFLNPYVIARSDTNSLAQMALYLAPGITDNRPVYSVHHNLFRQRPLDVSTERGSGGIALFGNDSVNHVNFAEVTFNHFEWFGGDAGSGGTRVYHPAIDWYRETIGTLGYNTGTNIMYGFAKVQESPDVRVIGNWAHVVDGDFVYSYQPGERTQENEYRRGEFRSNWAFRDSADDIIAGYFSAGDLGGFHELLIDGFYAPGFARGMQVQGLTRLDTPMAREGYGPVTLRNLHITDATSYALQLINLDASVGLYDSFLSATGSGSALRTFETNTNMRLAVKRSGFYAAGTGWGARMWGGLSFSSEDSSYESVSGEAIEIRQEPTLGDLLDKLYFERSNTLTGTVDVVTADISSGYFWNGATETRYPGGGQLTLGNGTSTYLNTWRFDYAGVGLFNRFQNDTDGGAAATAWTAQDSAGSIMSLDNNYADSDRADAFSITAESTAAKMDLDSVATNGLVRIRARGTDGKISFHAGSTATDGYMDGTNFIWFGNLQLPGRAYNASTWNGSSNVVTEDAFRDAYESLVLGGGDTDDQTAAEVPFSATGTVSATDVQAAIAEVDSEKAPLASPTFTGTVTLPNDTVALGTKTTGNYAAGDAEAGAALTGDSATSFFNSGTLEDARLPSSMADKTITGSLNIPNGAAPTTDATGELALDTTITDHKSLLQYDGGADEMLVIAIPRANLDTTDGDVIKYDAATDAFVMSPDATGGGGSQTPWTQDIDAAFYNLTNVANISATNFNVGTLTLTNALTVPNGGTGLTSGTSGGVPYFNSSTTMASSGALAANAIVIGGGAGAAPSTTTTGSGILTWIGTPSSANLAAALTGETGTGAFVLADSPSFTTKINIPNGTADATLSTAGDMHLNTTDEQLSFHSAADGEISGEVALPLIQHRAWSFDPDAVCDGAVDRLFLMTVGDQAPEGIKIVEWKVSFEADPTTEADLDLKYADAFIGVANSAVIDVLDTTAGVSSEDTNANINSGNAIANGKVLYLEFGTAYTESNHQIIFEMWFYMEED